MQKFAELICAVETMGDARAGWRRGTGMVWVIALGTVVVHLAVGWRYGFDRDELMALEDARHLAWGYVQYPPMTAFFGRVALMLFGSSLVGFRFFAALAQALALVLTGLLAKELGGGKGAQVLAVLAGVPFCLGGGALLQYISFDYVCWVLVAYGMMRVVGSGNASVCQAQPPGPQTQLATQQAGRELAVPGEEQPKRTDRNGGAAGGDARWWLVVGAGMGLGMMAKYTMGFLAVGVAAGVLLTGERRYLRSGWLWCGKLVAMGIFFPNFLWQWRRGFPSLEFLKFIHERDVRAGLTDWFLLGQLELTLLAFPLAVAGIYFYFFAAEGKRFRVMGWMYLVPLVLFLAMRGRDYYLAPGYPMLYAAGAVWVERKTGSCQAMEQRSKEVTRKMLRRVVGAALAVDILVAGAVALPIAPVNSRWWGVAAKVDSVFPEEIGWPEFVEEVAGVRDRLPAGERTRVGILAGNYGELGALNLYGEKYGLPRGISAVNSSWERGYGEQGPETVIVTGYSRQFLERHFASCEVAGHTWNRYGVANEETMEDPEIFVCRGLQGGWEEFWKGIRKFA